MKDGLSVIIHTLNEEKNILRALESVKWADEIIVCDMHSDDKTVEIAKKFGAKVIYHQRAGYVEPARNFAISKASYQWILILDADEEVPESLRERIKALIKSLDNIDYVSIPRKNIIFGKWMKASGWWPDYNIRLFKQGSVVWSNKIHSKPQLNGKELIVPAEEQYAIIHYNYNDLSQYLIRLDRYASIQASELVDEGYVFNWKDTIEKPIEEFLSRFFAQRGFEDGVHGLILSLLQAFSFLIMYAKVWEKQKFTPQEVQFSDLKQVAKKSGKDFSHWLRYSSLSKNSLKRVIQKIYYKVG